jgi:hypothetical protein
MLAKSGIRAGRLHAYPPLFGIEAGRHVLAVWPPDRYSGALTNDSKAAVAQLVEHLIRNEGVGGSSPFRGTMTLKH